MSISITINDTHAAVKSLEAKGAEKELAEEIVATFQRATLARDPATQGDVLRVEKQVGELRAELYRSLLIHGFVTVTTIVGAVAVLVNLLRPVAGA